MMENIKRLFENDKDRVTKFSRTLQLNNEFIYFDFSKTHVSDQDIESLLKKLESKDIYKKINDMFEGKKINYTENREVLHVLLRDKHVLRSVKSGDKGDLRDESVMVYEELIKMRDFVEKFHQGRIRGVNNKILDTIVNIGIGGSDLGPRMVCESLVHYSKRNIKTYFMSNIDATDSLEVFDKINPDTTLFIVVSKTFTTLETIKNAELAIKLMKKSLNRSGEEICKHHFVAVSSNQEEVAKYNISTVFTMWDFVGGRYSLWSAVGLSIALYIGFENFLELLSGASMVDEKFKSLKELDNIEIMHALIEIFYSENGYNNKCLVSYDQYLEKMYLYLQQSEMESNGKYSENTETGMIIWGGVGTNVQHSFFQLLHQGTRKILAEFLFPFSPLNEEENHHNMVLSNCLAQSMALMEGKAGEKGVDYFPGNRPSVILGYSKLTPKVLGALIAHYEHKIFVQGIYWEINSYDQFGVTLGKKIASTLLSDIESKKRGNFDESTNSILKKLFELK